MSDKINVKKNVKIVKKTTSSAVLKQEELQNQLQQIMQSITGDTNTINNINNINDTSVKDTSVKDTSLKDTSVKDTSVKDTSNINNSFDYYKNTFDVIDTILHRNNKKDLVNHQFTSYKQFIEKELGDIIRKFNTREIYFNYDANANKHKQLLKIDFMNYNLGRPTIHENDGSFKVMSPDIARLRNLSYSAPLTLNVKLTSIIRTSSNTSNTSNISITGSVIETLDQEHVKEEIFNNINFGRIPIMVMGENCVLNKQDGTTIEQNGECAYDVGGYFIIGGNEKVIISQERIAENEPFVFNNQKKLKGKEIEIRCASDQHFSVVVSNVIRYLYKDTSLEFESPSFKNPVPIFILFKALGVKTDKKLFEYIAWDLTDEYGLFITDLLKKSFERFKKICKTHNVNNNDEPEKFQEIIINYLKLKNTNREIKLTNDDKIQYVKKILEDEILPHIGVSFDKKAKYLGYMCRKLILVQHNYVPHDDRDAYDNKLADTPGRLLAIQFRQCFNKLVKDMVKSITREIKTNKSRRDVFDIINNNNIYKIIKPTIIDGGLKYALATGNWGIKTGGKGSIKVGTAQVLNRLSYQSFISHLRRINSPSDKSGNGGKIVKPRKLHGTSWGYLCPCETPEGQPIGLVKNLSLLSKITTNSNSIVIRNLIYNMNDITGVNSIKLINDITPLEISNSCLIFVNGDWIAVTDKPDELVKELRSQRRQANINIYTGITWNLTQRTIKINTDAGRFIRPMYIVDNNNLRITDEYIKKLKDTNYSFDFLISPKFYETVKHAENINNINNISSQSQPQSQPQSQSQTQSQSQAQYNNMLEGVIEYIDTNEVNNCYFAMSDTDLCKDNTPYNNKFSHCEIYPGLVLGAVANLIPFPDDNQSPRNLYQCLGLNELVYMADGSKKIIKDVKIGDSVLSFNPITFKISNTIVINHFIIQAHTKVYKIKLISGIEIIATGDHKFISITSLDNSNINYNSINVQHKWDEVKNMIIHNTKIGVINFDYKHEPKVSFIEIDNITDIDTQLVCDITVESDNHSFITTGGILSSNCAMGKQSICLFAYNYQRRMDTIAHIMNNLEKALVKTKFAKYANYDELPCGVNAMVAIGCYTGYNMEDSVLINQGAIDRGLFRATFYRTYKDDEKKIQSSGREEKFAKPNIKYTRGTKPGNYNKLDERGFVRKDEYVNSDDMIIGKVLPLKNKLDENGHQLYKDCSTSLRSNESGFVDKIYTDRNADGFRFVKIRIRTERIPIIGDKFASRCAQKGTIGMTYPQEQMPFNADGISPDIIMNPHAIPSRMTIGQLMECILGKACATLGGYSDCTPFNKVPYDKICAILEENGLNYTGDEILYSGITGQQMDVKLFFGPTYYQRLKHMVSDKLHSRASGPVVQLTRQPAEGRSRDGGLRIGEMERDCFVKGTPITLYNGLSLNIEDFENYNINVLGWNKEYNGVVPALQTNFLYKGNRECVNIYLEDGRVLTCTPEHKLLSSNNEWICANDIKINETYLQYSMKYPQINIKNELEQCNNWELIINMNINNKLILKTHNVNEYFKTLAFIRILGYMHTSGVIYFNKNKNSYSYIAKIFLKQLIDVNAIITDIKLFTNNECIIQHNNIQYTLCLPNDITENIINIINLENLKLEYGIDTHKPTILPHFILHDNCPLPIIREFIAGIFGGDHNNNNNSIDILNITNNTFIPIALSYRKYVKYENMSQLIKIMEQLKVLLHKFNIDSTIVNDIANPANPANPINNINNINKINKINKKIVTKKLKNIKYKINLQLDIEQLLNFYDKIGLRYSYNKNMRLDAIISFTKFHIEINRQNTWLLNSITDIYNTTNASASASAIEYCEIIELRKIINNILKSEIAKPIINNKLTDIINNIINKSINNLLHIEPIINNVVIPSNNDVKNYLLNKTKKIYKAQKQYSDINNRKIQYNGEIILNFYTHAFIHFINNMNAQTSFKKCNIHTSIISTMKIKVIDIRGAGINQVYDIQVNKEESFLANGIIAHNCLIAHGVMGFMKERMMDVSDKFTIYICKECGLFSIVNPATDGERKCDSCENYTDFMELRIPYACKLLMQELEGMMITPRFNVSKPNL